MSKPSEAPSAFISHANPDAALAQSLVERLERSGVSCWIAPRDIRQGEVYADEIMRGIRECPVFILLHSEAADCSQFVWRETNEAVTLGKTILPVRLGEFVVGDRMRFLLAAIQWEMAEARGVGIDHRALADRVCSLLERPRQQPRGSETTRTSKASRKRTAWMAVAFSTLVALAGGLWMTLPATPRAPLRGRLEVQVPVDGTVREDRNLGTAALVSIRHGDRVRIIATLDRPGFMYVVWISRDGTVPVFPWIASDWTRRSEGDAPRRRLELPERTDRGYPMDCGDGMEAVLLLARSSPLPPTLDVADLLGGFPWRGPSGDPSPHCCRLTEDGVLPMGTGESGPAMRDESGTRPADFKRLEEELAAEAESIAPLRAWWGETSGRLRSHFEHVDGVAFATSAATDEARP